MNTRIVTAAAVGAMAGIVAFALFIAAQASGPTTTDAADPRATAAAAPVVDGSWEVWDRNPDGTPVRWDPCTPIGWVLDDTRAPEDAYGLVTRAMDRIAEASGLRFEFRGTTGEEPRRDRPLLDDDGRTWAPVLVSWVPGGSVDLPLGDGERGVTVPVAVRDGGPQVFVTGQVLFNSDKTLLPGFEDRHASWGAVVLHELGHLVGLDHVQDAREMMHPTPGFGPVELGAGDRAGLAEVGADAGCQEGPDPQELDVSFD